MEKSLAEIILDGLESQKFFDWYNGKFTDYVQGGEQLSISREAMLTDIRVIFDLPE